MDELACMLALNRAPGAGPATINKLIKFCGSPQQVFENASHLQGLGLHQSLQDYLQSPDWQQVEQDINWGAASDHFVLIRSHPHYPQYLRELHNGPMVLYGCGPSELLQQPQIAIVGTRHPSPLAADTATAFAREISQAGWVVTSGLALGIDAHAHRGAVMENAPTIAVLGTGADVMYPLRNKGLASEILHHSGVILSEFPLGTGVRRQNFPQRNRIISGLSRGVFVVEAASQSGSLITAKYALEQNRDVFAMPGSIHNPRAKGCHALIKQGAKLVENIQDIWDELMPGQEVKTNIRPQKPVRSGEELDEQQRQLLDKLDFSATSVDSLIERTGQDINTITSNLLVLELQGYVQALPGGYYCRYQ